MQPRKGIDDFHWINFINQTGLTIPAFGCFVAVSWQGPSEDGDQDTRGELIVAAQSSEYGSQTSHYLNGPVAVRAGGAGTCAQPWLFPMLAHVKRGDLDDAMVGQDFGPVSGSFELAKYVGGFRLVRKRSSDLCLVLMAPMLSLVGKTAEAIAKGSSGDVTIQQGRDLLSLSATTYSARGVNLFADLPQGATVLAVRTCNQWAITAAECTVPR